jgi:hypothetical protein
MGESKRRLKMCKRKGILTSIDESVVILLVRLVGITLLRKGDCGDTLGMTRSVVAEIDFSCRANGRSEQFL